MRYKLLYTILILLVYLVGRSLPLYGIDTSSYGNSSMDAQTLLMQTISGDRYRSSLFALGISPYMIAGIVVQIIMALRGSESRSKISPRRLNQISIAIMFVLAVIQAVLQVRELDFVVPEYLRLLAQVTAVSEMVTGAFAILWLSERNKRFGIGGQTALILVNILDGLMSTLQGHSIEELYIPLLVSAIVLLLVVGMENTEKRIPVQRISIHNIYADKNYMAIKLNPIGVMPVMFTSAFFMLPQMLLNGLSFLLPDNDTIQYLYENMTLTSSLGIITYIVILYLLTIGFSIVFISPGDITEQFLKSGDSILNLHAGRDTRRYLTRQIFFISFFSATMMGLCLGVPMFLQLWGNIDSSLVMLPSSVMILTGVWCNLYQEIVAVRDYDAYQPFI
jgi:preprotein translocase subunit SecY